MSSLGICQSIIFSKTPAPEQVRAARNYGMQIHHDNIRFIVTAGHADNSVYGVQLCEAVLQKRMKNLEHVKKKHRDATITETT